MLRRATPRLSVLKLTKSAPTIHRLHSVVNVNPAVHSSDAGFFTPTSQPSSSSSSQNPSQPPQKKGRYDRVSDHEYNVRVGRACDLLQATLPDFMRTGLVDYQRDLSSRSSGLTLLDVFTFRALMARGNGEEDVDGTSANDQVYDPIIHFYFRPAPPLTSATSSSLSAPTDEEAASVSFSGRSLYFASAHVLRHTLNVLFSDARVEVKKLRLERKGGQPRVEDVIHLRLEFIGHARVTGQEHNYTLIFRYEIDNDTGRIVRHTVERVEPAIGRKLWMGIATVWQRLIGHEPSPIPQACHLRSNENHYVQPDDTLMFESNITEEDTSTQSRIAPMKKIDTTKNIM